MGTEKWQAVMHAPCCNVLPMPCMGIFFCSASTCAEGGVLKNGFNKQDVSAWAPLCCAVFTLPHTTCHPCCPMLPMLPMLPMPPMFLSCNPCCACCLLSLHVQSKPPTFWQPRGAAEHCVVSYGRCAAAGAGVHGHFVDADWGSGRQSACTCASSVPCPTDLAVGPISLLINHSLVIWCLMCIRGLGHLYPHSTNQRMRLQMQALNKGVGHRNVGRYCLELFICPTLVFVNAQSPISLSHGRLTWTL